jgi:hypothetical protein
MSFFPSPVRPLTLLGHVGSVSVVRPLSDRRLVALRAISFDPSSGGKPLSFDKPKITIGKKGDVPVNHPEGTFSTGGAAPPTPPPPLPPNLNFLIIHTVP